MARSPAVALTDILEAIDLARETAFGMAFDAFDKDRIRKAATERAILTISEAVRHLPDDMIVRHPDLRWQDMRGIGNRIRHGSWTPRSWGKSSNTNSMLWRPRCVRSLIVLQVALLRECH